MAAEDTVLSIIDQALTVAATKAAEATEFANEAITASSGAAFINYQPISFAPSNVEPSVYIPQHAAGVDSALYDATYDRIIADLTGKFEDFFNEYFPAGDAFQAAQDWLVKALTVGGTGIAPHIEDQIWQRERARTLREANRAGEEIIGTFAARGFPLPPGAMQHQLNLNQQRALEQNAESSRTRAIEQARMELENVRFAVQEAIDYRVKGIQAAGDYIRIIAMGPEIAMRLATSAAGAQAQLINAANSYYSSRIRLEELKFSVIRFNADQRLDAAKTEVREFSNRLNARTQTLSAAAQAAGNQASAALNAVHASAQVAVQGETS